MSVFIQWVQLRKPAGQETLDDLILNLEIEDRCLMASPAIDVELSAHVISCENLNSYVILCCCVCLRISIAFRAS